MKKNTKKSLLKTAIAVSLVIASISPIAVALGKQIIDDYQNQLFNDSSRAIQDWTSFPNINTPTKEMFHNTEGLEPLSSVARGQMVTPAGWLGTYKKQVAKNPGGTFASNQSNEKDYWTNTLALVGWDGSIIWTNDESNIAIYSAKYNFATNTIFVVRTQDPTGAGGLNQNLQTSTDDACKVTFTIHDATTGKILFNSYIDAGNNKNISWEFKDIFNSNTFSWDNYTKKDFYYQDMLNMSNGDIVWFYIPNFAKLRKDDKTLADYMNLMTNNDLNNNSNLNKNYYKVFIIKKQEIDNVRNGVEGATIAPVDWISKNLNKNNIFTTTFQRYPLLFSPIFFAQDNYLHMVVYCTNKQGIAWKTSARWKYENDNLILNDQRAYRDSDFLNNVDKTNFSNLKITQWDSQKYNENTFLLPTRNMFNQNIVTFAYPTYANTDNSAAIRLPIFNVFQSHGNKLVASGYSDANLKGQYYKEFNFGSIIYKNYIDNNLANKNPFQDIGNVIKWYPWPNAISQSTTSSQYAKDYTNQLYSRLISVSPFDNTIIYASRPNRVENKPNSSLKEDLFTGFAENESKFASFWIGNSNTGNVVNMVIPNSTSAPYGSIIDTDLIARELTKSGGIFDIYKNGFWFDVNSLTGQANNLNLYFPVTGTSKNTTPSGANTQVKSTPIGCIKPIVTNFISMNNLINYNTSTPLNKVPINAVAYTNFITSRADLNQWFPRTYQHLTKGSNYYSNNEVLNDYNVNNVNRAVASKFNSQISDANWFGPNKNSVELFSSWATGNYNKLAVKRAEIVTNINSKQQATPALNVTLKFNLENSNWSSPFYNDSAGIARIKTFEYPVTITNASWQLLDSWSTNYRIQDLMYNLPNSTNNSIDTTATLVANTPEPTQGNYGSSFGTHNIGEWTKNGDNWIFNPIPNSENIGNYTNLLRLELGIDYNPNNNADSAWIRKLEAEEGGKFKQTYPDYNSNIGSEVTFSKIVIDFIKWKVANLTYGDLDDPTKGTYSPGQITIKAYLKLNPRYLNLNSTIYQLSDGTQIGYDSSTGLSYIYKDEYTGNRVIYQQTSPNWNDNSKYGLGSSVNDIIKNSWISVPSQRNYYVTLANGTTINDILLRDGSTPTSDMFTAAYNSSKTAIVLKVKDQYKDWIRTRFKSYNQMLGRQIIFQYATLNSSDWKEFSSIRLLDDNKASEIFSTSNEYTIPWDSSTPNEQFPKTIERVRIMLAPFSVVGLGEENVIVDSNNLLDSSVFVSDPITLDVTPVDVDYEWLNNVSLNGQTDHYLNGAVGHNINQTDLTNALNDYASRILNQPEISSIKDKLKLTYSLDQTTYVDANKVWDLLNNLWKQYSSKNLGIIGLYDKDTFNSSSATKIYVKFAVKDEFKDSISINNINFQEGNNIIQKTNIKFFVDLNQWINLLQTEKTSVIQGTTPNSISSFTPPKMTGNKGTNFLFGWTYNEIVTALNDFRVTVEYQKLDGSWTNNKQDITSYDSANPYINIRFKVDTQNSSIAVSINGTSLVQDTDVVKLILNVPLLIKIDNNIWETFKNNKPVTGNTWTINVDGNKETNFIDSIRDFSKNSNLTIANDPLWNNLANYIEIQYALGDNLSFNNATDFKTTLKNSDETKYNNQIKVKIVLKTLTDGSEPKFVLDPNSIWTFTLYDANNLDVKIYVHGSDYEASLNSAAAVGSTGNLQITYPQNIQEIINDPSKGIKLQYSLKQNIQYQDPIDTDIANGWVDIAPNVVPIGTKSLKIRITVIDDSLYEYGMGNAGGTPSVYSIDLTQLSQLVDIDSKWFNQVEIVNTNNTLLYLNNLNAQNLMDWEDKIWAKSQAVSADPAIKNLVKIVYTIENDQNSYDAQGLINRLQQMIQDYNSSSLGIVKLWGEDQSGIKINATFSKVTENTKVIFVDDPTSITPSNNLTSWANTFKIQTEIDLTKYAQYAQSQKIVVALGTSGAGSIQSFTMPTMSGTKGSGFLNGYSYDEIATRLAELGINFVYHEINVPQSNPSTGSIWKLKDQVNAYDPTNPRLALGVKFTNNYEAIGLTKGNIIVKLAPNKIIGNLSYLQNGNLTSPPIASSSIIDPSLYQLSLLAPTLVNVNLSQLNQLSFEGNTKNISNLNTIQNKVNAIIEATKKLITQNNNLDISDLNLEIRFSLNNIQLESSISDLNTTEDGIWYTLQKFNDILLNSTTNYNTNSVYAKFYIKDNPKIDGVDKYLLSSTASININPSDLSSNAKFKIYINNETEIQEDWIVNNLKLFGSQDNFDITNLNTWLSSQVPAGLEVEYNAVVDPNNVLEPDANSWKSKYNEASPIDSLRNYWIRFKVKDAYVFEGALANDPQHSKTFKLDASQIQVALKIQSSWLEQIQLTGNLKDLIIDETNAINEINQAHMMPVVDIIQIEYTYNDIDWFNKNDFTNKLQQLAGAKDDVNWIILREDIKARFVLNSPINDQQDPKYLLEVDTININEDNSNNISKQLITSALNNGVKGYINLDKLAPYQATNFTVTGTDTEAYLNIKKYNELNRLLVPYSSNPLFNILYKHDTNANYEEINKVWTPGQELTSTMRLNGTYEDRYFAMQFKVTNSDYDLYIGNNQQANNVYEYSTDATDSDRKIDIKISVAIINPLSSSDISIQFLNVNNQPQWYNNSGAFQLLIEKIDSQGTKQSFNSFQNFLDNWAINSLNDDQRDALELVYYIAQDANEDEYQKAMNELSNYDKNSIAKYNVWKNVSEEQNLDLLNYQLKVNDYVILAVRIKEEKLTSDSNPNGYVLKDNDHAATNQIRAFGYKVHTDYIDVDWSTLKVRNVDAAESASYGLDGYAMLDQISLKKTNDPSATISDDYLNVSLQLNYFTEFYYNNQGQVLVSGDGSRLVKRDSTDAEEDGFYKDIDGNNLLDDQGNPIPILYQAGQKDNGILAKPIKGASIQRSHALVETNINSYALELNSGEQNALYSFFKFQDIAIQFTNKKGLSDPNDQDVFDYYVDQNNIAKNYIIDTQIKFPIENNNLIRYTFNSEEFISYIKDPNNIENVYENSINPDKSPVNGQSKLIHMYSVTRQQGQDTSTTNLSSVGAIMWQILADFGSKVVLKTTYTPVNGGTQIIANNDLSSITTLSNGDRFRIEIVSADENNLIFAQQPSPLVFTISGLYEQDIEEEYLQYLRVQQSGNFNGEGQFEIFVDNPYDDQDDHLPLSTLLQGYKFMVRVWDANKEIKQDWTNDYESISNLSNGDKVEWKLVAPTGAPVEKAYYNTVANMDQHDANNQVYSFSQVAKVGNSITTIIENSIGLNPIGDVYPENSGLLISGLADKVSDTFTSITEEEFIRLMNIMNFGYTGINGQGNMVSDRDITTIVVNTSSITRDQYTMKYLIDQGYITFYSNNVEFNWNQVLGSDGNWLISPGTLSNGDQITIKYQDPTMSYSYTWEAPEVSGLKERSDSMSLLAYVGIGAASFATLGVFAIIYFVARNKKLKNIK